MFAITAVYAGLWALTHFAGAASLKVSLLAGMGTSDGFREVASYQALDRFERPSYYLRMLSPLPLVVYADFGYVCGTLCGQGASEFILWIPGVADPPHLTLSRWWR